MHITMYIVMLIWKGNFRWGNNNIGKVFAYWPCSVTFPSSWLVELFLRDKSLSAIDLSMYPFTCGLHSNQTAVSERARGSFTRKIISTVCLWYLVTTVKAVKCRMGAQRFHYKCDFRYIVADKVLELLLNHSFAQPNVTQSINELAVWCTVPGNAITVKRPRCQLWQHGRKVVLTLDFTCQEYSE